jgi:ABC-2 type transport system permease protein
VKPLNKFLAVIKREYVQRVRTKMFIIFTILGPLMMALFTIVPGLIFALKTGDATRLAVVDQSGKIYERVREGLMYERGKESKPDPNVSAPNMNESTEERMRRAGKALIGSYVVEQVAANGRPVDVIRKELEARIEQNQLDGYIIIPADVNAGGEFAYYARNVSDVITKEQIKDRLNEAVRDQRLAEANISQERMREINKEIDFKARKAGVEAGEEDSGGGFWLVFGVGFLIYIMIIMYGQVILAAVIEEKETRIAEVLFSSVSSFKLMLGKLIGVSLVALTQYAIWGLAVLAFAIYGVTALASSGFEISFPRIAPSVIAYLFVFFLLGYFVYATIYALVGAMVTTAQEGGQVAIPIMFLLVIGFYLAFPVIRSPNSSFSFWVSMFPFFSPITMPVRIITQQPPFWQIALSMLIAAGTVIFLVWLAARIYRIGMLMYGKRATLPEVMRWVRQA